MWRIFKRNKLELKPALFMHIQKTAGTSIVDLAARNYGNKNVCSHGDYIGRTPKEFAKIPFLSGHFGYDFARTLMEDRFSFFFLRDPVERILSMYYFCRKRDPAQFEIYKLAHECDLEKFLQLAFEKPMVRATVWNHQAWQLAHGFGKQDNRSVMDFKPDEILKLALNHLGKFDYVGFTESFEKDKDFILKKLGIVNRHANVRSNVTIGKPESKELPSSTRKLLDQLTELDREVYDYAQSSRKRTISQ
jgi:Sulfotransferase family